MITQLNGPSFPSQHLLGHAQNGAVRKASNTASKMARRTNSLAEQVALGALTLADSASASSHATGSAAGAGRPARLVRLSSAVDTTSKTDATGDSTTTAVTTSSAAHDPSLPAGWLKVMHDSGLPCYVHEQQQLVSWSKPYVLDLLCSSAEFVKVAQQHVPPLSLFKASVSGATGTTTQEKANGAPTTQETSERSSVSGMHVIKEGGVFIVLTLCA